MKRFIRRLRNWIHSSRRREDYEFVARLHGFTVLCREYGLSNMGFVARECQRCNRRQRDRLFP